MSSFSYVLLVDDDEITNYLHKRILEKAKIADEVHVLLNGKEAYDFFKSLDNGDYFPGELLVLLDLNMPVMDGWEFLDKYKYLSSLPKDRIHIYILSTSENPDDIQRAETYSFIIEGYVNKPLTLDKLKRFTIY
jgi:CheY-like chemotaxis protein